MRAYRAAGTTHSEGCSCAKLEHIGMPRRSIQAPLSVDKEPAV
jgi:hypothetical protein